MYTVKIIKVYISHLSYHYCSTENDTFCILMYVSVRIMNITTYLLTCVLKSAPCHVKGCIDFTDKIIRIIERQKQILKFWYNRSTFKQNMLN